MCLCSTAGWNRAATLPTKRPRSVGTNLPESLPASMRE
jgi:hypothetical protein